MKCVHLDGLAYIRVYGGRAMFIIVDYYEVITVAWLRALGGNLELATLINSGIILLQMRSVNTETLSALLAF